MKQSWTMVAWVVASYLSVAGVRADVTLNLESDLGGAKQATTMKISKKGMRIEQPRGAMVILPESRQMLMINSAQKTVMLMTMPEPETVADTEKTITPQITKTGKTEQINGFACEQYLVTLDGGTTSELWISPEGPDMSALADVSKTLGGLKQPGASASFDWIETIRRDKTLTRFPIRAVTSKITTTLLSFNTDALSEAEFAAPADYQTMRMPSFSGLSQLGGGRRSGARPGADAIKQALDLQKQSGEGSEITPEQIKALQDAVQKMAPPQ